ncbi:MAG: HAMP domain-containing histidine kinase [Betaproteobacteria bacterium]|nr:HAMP domain-containing histidine kinase [Betaproteobacteria bacterium]
MKVGLDFPQRYYPRSFLKLLLLAFALVALPLIFAFVNTAVNVQRLADQSQTVVAQAAQAARNSRLLMEQVTALERVMRQYLILGDRELVQDYERVRARFKSTTSDLSLLPLDELQLLELNRTIDKEQELYELLLRAPLKPEDKSALIEGYIALSDLAQRVLDISNDLIDRELENMRVTGERAQRILWLQLLATIPVGVLIAVGMTLLVARPIRQLDQAIRRLGAGDFGAEIRLQGPADVRYLGARLEGMRQRLLELDQQKRLFFRHVSHELKTPLTSLREGSELLAEGTAGPLSSGQREIVTILRQKSLELQKLIEDLLNYHRAHESLTRLELGQVLLNRVVLQVLDDHRLAAQARGIRADLHLDPVRLRADADKLRVVADNLISNAIKYSPDGGIISLALRREGRRAIFDVSDSGPGIPAEDRERIFDWFFRGEHGHQGRVHGSGLGLAIAREFVAAHRGRIEVVNDPGGGAHFRVSLPLSTNAGGYDE